MKFKQVTIVGTGLIGGSLALALKKHRLVQKVVGCDRAPVLEKALKLRALDTAEKHPEAAIAGSELVVLATPVGAIIDLIERLGPLLPPGALLTDVGSTKAEIMQRASMIFGAAAGERFLPGHPMAGKEHSGIEHAEATLFEGAAWLLTPFASAKTGPQDRFAKLVAEIGSKVIFMEPERQDRMCAWVSHLPQMISTAVASSLLEEFGSSAGLAEVGGRALRDMTRIAASPYSMWRDIAYTNAGNIEEALLKVEQRLAHIRENLRSPELKAEFEHANRFGKSDSPRRHRGTEK